MHEHHDHSHRDHPHGDGLPSNRGPLYEELVHHLPFSVSAVAVGLIFAGIICFLAEFATAPAPDSDHAEHAVADVHELDDEASEQPELHASDRLEGHTHSKNPFISLFHLFHPAHMLFSAAATTAMFWRYDRRVWKAVITGLIGAVGICGLSDIVMPQLSLPLLGKHVSWHICIVEHPSMVLSFAAVGVVVGLGASAGVRQSTFFSHSLHVFSSTMASIFYLIGPLGRLAWIDSIGIVFVFIILAVMVPCCLSDIVFPLILARPAQERYRAEHVGCC